MRRRFNTAHIYLFLSASLGFGLVPNETTVQYPEGYRQWMHVKSSILDPQHPNANYRGFNHTYANDLAVTGYQSGNFPEGSVIVVDVIEAVPAKDLSSEGGRRHMDVMQKDSIKFSATGGWGYGQFEGDNKPRMLSLEQQKTCSGCHAKQKDKVFSEMRK